MKLSNVIRSENTKSQKNAYGMIPIHYKTNNVLFRNIYISGKNYFKRSFKLYFRKELRIIVTSEEKLKS